MRAALDYRFVIQAWVILSFSPAVMAGFNQGRPAMSFGIWFKELGNDLADIGGAFKDVCIDIAAAARKIARQAYK
ncbi:hypothetical protein ASD58_22865 [Duganella sp. Root1480D1]|nr:hypothetical protein ASD58_22865 [Duganella sp. Root1480D1]